MRFVALFVCLASTAAFNLGQWSRRVASVGREAHSRALRPLEMVRYSSEDGVPAALVEERDACGVGFIASLNQKSSHDILRQALNALGCMEHRGATSADNISGDGAGVSTDIPWKLFDNIDKDEVKNGDGSIAAAVAMIFLPKDGEESVAMKFIEETAAKNNRE